MDAARQSTKWAAEGDRRHVAYDFVIQGDVTPCRGVPATLSPREVEEAR